MAGLETVALFSQIVSVGSKAFGEHQESKTAAEMAAYNAAVSRQAAETTAKAGEIELYRARKKAAAVLGAQRAGYAKAGVRTNFGTPLEVMAESAGELELDALMTEFNYKTQQNQYLAQAAMDDYAAKQHRILSYLRPVTTLLSEAPNFATKLNSIKSPGGYGKSGLNTTQRLAQKDAYYANNPGRR